MIIIPLRARDAYTRDREQEADAQLGEVVATAVAFVIVLLIGAPILGWAALRDLGVDRLTATGILLGGGVVAFWAASNGYWWQLALGAAGCSLAALAVAAFTARREPQTAEEETPERRGPNWRFS